MQRQGEIKAWSILTNQSQRAVEEPREGVEGTSILSAVTGSFLLFEQSPIIHLVLEITLPSLQAAYLRASRARAPSLCLRMTK